MIKITASHFLYELGLHDNKKTMETGILLKMDIDGDDDIFHAKLRNLESVPKRCCDNFSYPLNDGYGKNLEVLGPADVLCCRNSSEKLQRNFVIIKRKRIGYLPSEKHYYKCNYFVYFFNEVIIKCNLNFITCLLYVLPLPLKLPKNYQ